MFRQLHFPSDVLVIWYDPSLAEPVVSIRNGARVAPVRTQHEDRPALLYH